MMMMSVSTNTSNEEEGSSNEDGSNEDGSNEEDLLATGSSEDTSELSRGPSYS